MIEVKIDHDRHDEQGGDGQPPIGSEHDDHDQQDLEDGADDLGHGAFVEEGHCFGVIGYAAHQLAHRLAVEEAQREGLHMVEKCRLQLVQPLGRQIGEDALGEEAQQQINNAGDKGVEDPGCSSCDRSIGIAGYIDRLAGEGGQAIRPIRPTTRKIKARMKRPRASPPVI